MAQTAKTGAEVRETTENLTDFGKRATDEIAGRAQEAIRDGAQLVHRTSEATGEIQRQMAHRSADGTAQLGQVAIELLQQQTRHNVETLNALSGAVDWDRVVELQGELLRASFERLTRFGERYLEVAHSVSGAAVLSARDQARKIA